MQETDQFLDNLVSNWPILLAGQMKFKHCRKVCRSIFLLGGSGRGSSRAVSLKPSRSSGAGGDSRWRYDCGGRSNRSDGKRAITRANGRELRSDRSRTRGIEVPLRKPPAHGRNHGSLASRAQTNIDSRILPDKYARRRSFRQRRPRGSMHRDKRPRGRSPGPKGFESGASGGSREAKRASECTNRDGG